VSYDLFITPRHFDADAMRAYFAARAHYTVSDDQVHYGNDDTGIYFNFDINRDSNAEAGAASQPHVAFNMNYYRPHTFGLEAEPELAAFLQAFDSQIHDPQNEGMGDGPYSREGFLRAWNAGNRFGFRAIGHQDAKPPPPWGVDPLRLEAVWKWNYDRSRLQEKKGDNGSFRRSSG
jgi:hypothetical protein